MAKITIYLLLFIGAYVSATAAEAFYNLWALDIHGDTVMFSDFKGKKLMIVNTASKCGYTYQYGELQELYDQYGGDNFEIIGFPANNFNNQEPGDDEEIEKFCKENYGVTFTMMSKIDVVGTNMHPVYKWLTDKELNGVRSSEVQWNFQKYLIDENGNFVTYLSTTTSPLTTTVINWINSDIGVAESYGLDDKAIVYPNPAADNISIEFATGMQKN